MSGGLDNQVYKGRSRLHNQWSVGMPGGGKIVLERAIDMDRPFPRNPGHEMNVNLIGWSEVRSKRGMCTRGAVVFGMSAECALTFHWSGSRRDPVV